MMRFSLVALAVLAGCGAIPGALRDDPLPLFDMEEPLALFVEPVDESARQALVTGAYSGVYVVDAQNLDDLGDDVVGVEVQRVVENSPGELAGLRSGDLLLEVAVDDAPAVELLHGSQWRKLEIDAAPGAVFRVVFDRANREVETRFTVVARVRPPERHAVSRFREEDRVGVVLRTATEVEARRYGLGPGAGAVIVGLSRRSPWRAAGLGFGDVIVAVDERAVTHPQVVLERLRAHEGDVIQLVVGRGERQEIVEAAMTRRQAEVDDIYVPLLFSYEKARGRLSWSFLLSIFGYESTAVAWRFKLLWLIRFGGGDADRLIEEGGR